MSTPGTLTWFARHECRLAWRDWLSMMTAGRRRRARSIAIGLIVFAVFMHGLAYAMVGRYGHVAARRRNPSGGWACKPARHNGAHDADG